MSVVSVLLVYDRRSLIDLCRDLEDCRRLVGRLDEVIVVKNRDFGI